MTIKQTSQIAATLLCAILAITMIGGCNHAPSDKTESGATTTTSTTSAALMSGDGADNAGDGTLTSALMSDGVTELTGDSTTASTTITTQESTTTSASDITTTTSKPTTKKTTSKPTSKKTTKKTTSSTKSTTKKATTGTTEYQDFNYIDNKPDEADKKAVAERAVYYINKFRVEEGKEPLTVLPGLTEVAERRAVQLTEKFEHNTIKMREICGALKYGRYTDPADYGREGEEPYYDLNAAEAIYSGGVGLTRDALGRDIAEGFRASKAHWSYIGGADYKFIAVGVEDWDRWYTCVLVARFDTDKYPSYYDYSMSINPTTD